MSKHRNELDHTHILFSFSSSLQTELLLCAKSRDVEKVIKIRCVFTISLKSPVRFVFQARMAGQKQFSSKAVPRQF